MHETGKRRKLSRKTSIEDEIAQLRDLDLKALRIRWRNAFGKPAPEHLTRHLLFRIIAYRLRPIVLVTSMPRPSRCSSRLRGRKVRLRLFRRTWPGWIRGDLLHPPGLFWSANGTESPIGSWSCRTVLHGTVRRSIACPRSPLPSPGPNGTVPASLACGTGGPRSMPGSPNEVSTRNWQGPLRDLYEGLDRPGS